MAKTIFFIFSAAKIGQNYIFLYFLQPNLSRKCKKIQKMSSKTRTQTTQKPDHVTIGQAIDTIGRWHCAGADAA